MLFRLIFEKWNGKGYTCKTYSSKFYSQVISDACVKIAVLEICSDKNTSESVIGTIENISTVAVHYWYIKDALAGFC